MKDVKDYSLDFKIDLGLEGVKKTPPLWFKSGEEDLNKLKDLETLINSKEEHLNTLERRIKYYGGFTRYLYNYLNKTYHTLILIGFMFLGYTISGFKNIGVRIWKSPTSIAFYIIFTVGLFILSILEYAREKKESKLEVTPKTDEGV